MTERLPLKPRVLSLEDPVDLLRLAEGANPFIACSAVLDRQVVTNDMGLLIGGSTDQPICLFLSVTPLHDLGPWISHAARWIDLYPAWRRLHGLSPSALPVNVVLASPGVGEGVRLAVRLITLPVVLACFTGLGYGPSRCLCWEGWEEGGATQAQSGPIPRVRGETGVRAAISAEELAFFRAR
jgi:hypothetical protein